MRWEALLDASEAEEGHTLALASREVGLLVDENVVAPPPDVRVSSNSISCTSPRRGVACGHKLIDC